MKFYIDYDDRKPLEAIIGEIKVLRCKYPIQCYNVYETSPNKHTTEIYADVDLDNAINCLLDSSCDDNYKDLVQQRRFFYYRNGIKHKGSVVTPAPKLVCCVRFD